MNSAHSLGSHRSWLYCIEVKLSSPSVSCIIPRKTFSSLPSLISRLQSFRKNWRNVNTMVVSDPFPPRYGKGEPVTCKLALVKFLSDGVLPAVKHHILKVMYARCSLSGKFLVSPGQSKYVMVQSRSKTDAALSRPSPCLITWNMSLL